MPAKLRIHLDGDPPGHPFQHMAGLRKVVLDWLAMAAGPELATTVHDANQPNPYTISPLWSKEGGLWFEVAVLADPFVMPAYVGAQQYGEDLRLGPQRFRRTGLEVCERVTWEELLAARPLRALSVRLLTPTAHHAPGPSRKALVLPAPETYFGSWLDRWHLNSPLSLPESLLEIVREHVGISACRGQTETVLLDGKRRFIGFIGEVTFRVLDRAAAAEDLAALHALVRFADYCGTGVDTARGLGQTRAMC